MAEIEIGVAQHQCLDRRIGDQATLQSELEAWSQKLNAAHCRTDWQFTTEDARIKRKRLSPSTLLTLAASNSPIQERALRNVAFVLLSYSDSARSINLIDVSN